MPSSRKQFRKELEDALHSHLTMNHPIIQEVLSSGSNWPLLRTIVLQGYQLTKNFLDYIETLFYYCPLPNHKRGLLVNLYEESTGRISNTKNHVVLMQDFIKAIGVSKHDREAALALPPTQELIDYRMVHVKNQETYHIGAAAVMIASEGQNLETQAGAARHSLLAGAYGLKESDTLFFSVHQAEDVGHVQEGLSLVSELCTTERMQTEALEAVHHTCNLFWAMYEGIAQHWLQHKKVCAE